MDVLAEVRHPPQTLQSVRCSVGHALPLPRLDDGGGTKRQQPHYRANLEPRGGSIGEAQDVIVESILLVPQAIRPDLVDRVSYPEEMVDKLRC